MSPHELLMTWTAIVSFLLLFFTVLSPFVIIGFLHTVGFFKEFLIKKKKRL